jgi:hypothetical protein
MDHGPYDDNKYHIKQQGDYQGIEVIGGESDHQHGQGNGKCNGGSGKEYQQDYTLQVIDKTVGTSPVHFLKVQIGIGLFNV